MLTTAATLNAHGVTDIQTSSQAAEALRPIAGRFAFTIFALGIIGTGLLAVPVLAGSAAYAVGEALKWRVGLAQRPGRVPAFYGAIALATLVGATLNFTPLDPIKALFWSAVINGVAAVPIMVMIMLMASRKKVMGQFALRPLLKALGWIATAAMAAAAIGMFATWGVEQPQASARRVRMAGIDNLYDRLRVALRLKLRQNRNSACYPLLTGERGPRRART
jgi:Mn2+/Fe2+ NRAMP family transporter